MKEGQPGKSRRSGQRIALIRFKSIGKSSVFGAARRSMVRKTTVMGSYVTVFGDVAAKLGK